MGCPQCKEGLTAFGRYYKIILPVTAEQGRDSTGLSSNNFADHLDGKSQRNGL